MEYDAPISYKAMSCRRAPAAQPEWLVSRVPDQLSCDERVSHPRCSHCRSALDLVLADLGSLPIANDFLSAAQAKEPEPFYPLRALVCRSCRLVQLQSFFRSSDLFREDYAYLSSHSSSWLAHARTMPTR